MHAVPVVALHQVPQPAEQQRQRRVGVAHVDAALIGEARRIPLGAIDEGAADVSVVQALATVEMVQTGLVFRIVVTPEVSAGVRHMN